ncbi:enediyne antibiotic chromoprotein [Streptomyces sp. NPDC005408]|uniref:enediyne antibiotic chromoprotein n=1 Tax=Streptomyces sp. NPDC005408 TaxID=3155341 RepID=UPI0033BC6769
MLITRTRTATMTAFGAAVAASLLIAGPASADPALSVTPSTGLSDGQSVTVTGSGFTAGTDVSITECSSPTLCSATTVTATVGADGTFSAPYAVSKTFEGHDWSSGTTVTVDCAATQCLVSAWEQGAGTRTQTISFS